MKRAMLVAVCVAAFIAGSWIGRETLPPKPPERPVLKWLMKAARWGMWLVLLAEPQEKQQAQPRYSALDDQHIDHMRSL